VRVHDHGEPAAPGPVDPARPEQAIAAAAATCSNWGRWGSDDVRGTLNFLTDDKRVEGAGLVRRGVSFSLAQPFDINGPQTGWRRRTNPAHTMLDTGLDAARGTQGFPHGFAGRVLGRDGELPDGFAITPGHLEAIIAAHGVSVGRGDIVLVRTGQLARARRDGWGGYAGGPAPGLSFTCAPWLYRTEIAAIATDTWGFEVRPNEFDHAFQPLHQVVIPHIGLYIGEMWDAESLAADCAADGRYEFWLTAAPIPVTGAVGAPVNPIAVK
jgi:kynurenine formamidase